MLPHFIRPIPLWLLGTSTALRVAGFLSWRRRLRRAVPVH